jgi:hypothetical protein
MQLAMKIIPADPTIAELESKAAAGEDRAENESEPSARKLRAMAELCPWWMAALGSRKWIS